MQAPQAPHARTLAPAPHARAHTTLIRVYGQTHCNAHTPQCTHARAQPHAHALRRLHARADARTHALTRARTLPPSRAGSLVLDATPQQVWDVLLDHDASARVFRNVSSCERHVAEDGTKVLSQVRAHACAQHVPRGSRLFRLKPTDLPTAPRAHTDVQVDVPGLQRLVQPQAGCAGRREPVAR